MRITIIGSRGYIGRHLVHLLEKCPDTVLFCYDVLPADGNNPQPNYRTVDLSCKKEVENIVTEVDYLFHLSGVTGTYAGFDLYEKYVSVNECGLLHLLDKVRRSSCRPRIVFPSSRLVYQGADHLLKEDAPKEARTIYAANKITCENLLHAYWCSFGISYTVFRICVPYGNLLSRDYSYGTIGFFLQRASQGQPVCLYGDGSLKRTFTHIYDVCNLMLEALSLPGSKNQVYNIGGEACTLRFVAERIARKYQVGVDFAAWPQKDAGIESGHTCFDDSKIISLLGGYRYRQLAGFIDEI